MRSASAATQAILANAPDNGISTRDFIWITTVQGGFTFGFWNDIDPSVSVPVLDGATGLPVTRTYQGAGSLQSVDDITLAVGLNVYNIAFQLSDIHAGVQDMVRGHDIRNAHVEIHRGLFNPVSGVLVDAPMLHFMGTVDLAEPTRPTSGSSGAIAVTCTSNTNDLTRTNQSRFSHAFLQSRGSDDFLLYADIMGSVVLYWGVAKP